MEPIHRRAGDVFGRGAHACGIQCNGPAGSMEPASTTRSALHLGRTGLVPNRPALAGHGALRLLAPGASRVAWLRLHALR